MGKSSLYGKKPTKDVMEERLNVLKKCVGLEKKILFTPLSSFYQPILSEIMSQGSEMTFQVGKDFSFDRLKETFIALGMQQVPIVNDKGEFPMS